MPHIVCAITCDTCHTFLGNLNDAQDLTLATVQNEVEEYTERIPVSMARPPASDIELGAWEAESEVYEAGFDSEREQEEEETTLRGKAKYLHVACV